MNLSDEEKKELQSNLATSRDRLQSIIEKVRDQKVQLGLENRAEQRKYLQRIGDLSFAFGAAIVPVIIASKSKNEVNHIGLVLAGVGVYLVNGFLALWRNKSLIEQDSNDLPHIGLEEEIRVTPLINSINKLIFDLNNEHSLLEYKEANTTALSIQDLDTAPKRKVSFWLDLVVINFVIASMLVARSVWPFQGYVYWIIFSAIFLLMILLGGVSYIRYRESEIKLGQKVNTLDEVKKKYQNWHSEEVLKNK